jgi:hypothetical protein
MVAHTQENIRPTRYSIIVTIIRAAVVVVYVMVTVAVSIGNGRLVLEPLDQAVEDGGDDCTEKRSDPVDPVVDIEVSQHDIRTKRPSRIQRSSGEIDTCGSQLV